METTKPILPVRFSNLKWIGKSPAHYRYYSENPMEPSRQMRLGSAVDALVFGTNPVVVFQGGARRGLAWESFAKENVESLILLPKEMQAATDMAEALKQNATAFALFNGADIQPKLSWTMGSRECQGTPDAIGASWIADLKSTRNASPEWFQGDAIRRGYHAQLSWYQYGALRAGRANINDCWIVAIESSPPYPIVCHKLTPKAIQDGTKVWKLWWERLMVCEQADAWPGYAESSVVFDTPDAEMTLVVEGEELDV